VRCGQAANLADIQLFTSIPPRISRTNAAGEEIGESYQADCIASWINAGFAPTTINARSEDADSVSGVERITLERDASEVTGRPHPYFADLLSTIAQETQGPFALVNADILIPSPTGLAERVTSLTPGQMIIGRRLNVPHLGASGTPYFSGYDFFGAHSEDVASLARTQLVFGAPWWDHFFPLAMHLRGCRIKQLEPQVIHLRHDERWSLATYRALGDRFINEIQPLVGAGEYARHLRRILAGGGHGRRAAARDLTLHGLRPLDSDKQRRLILDRVGNLNLAVIDRLAPPPPSAGVRAPLRLRVQTKLLRLGGAKDIFSSTIRNSPKR
jgi:hypothetical protein